MSSLPTGTVTFLFTDIVGSTRRWREDAEMASLLARHDELTRSAVGDAGGHWVKHTGDGVLAVFDEARAAVTAAVEIQRRLRHDGGLDVRIGIHTGEAELRADDYFGLAVSSAARVMDAGHGGQILLSEATKLVLGSNLGPVELADLGRHRLKDLGEAHHVFQIDADGLETDFPPLRTLEQAEHNLPLQLTAFIGRDQELDDVVALVRSERLVTLTGVGGAGKTRLALQAAAEVVDEYPDGVWLVELAAVTDPAAVPSALAAALGVKSDRGDADDLIGRIVGHLEGRTALIVLDNCEHLLGAAAHLTETLLSRLPGVTMLASSREGLGIRGERLFQVPSLRADGGDSEAARLFLDRARAVNPRFELAGEGLGHVERICRLLDGIPLAIELAAARARVLSPEQIAGRLDDRFRLLTGGARSALPRQQTLEATIDWSYRMLSDGERRLFDRLSVFVGGFDLEAVEAVCTDDEVSDLVVIDLIEGLVEKSMVIADFDTGGAPRYRLLETLRQYAARRLAESDEALARWKSRHLDHYGRLARERTPLSWDPGRHRGWYATEYGNLFSALEWARIESDARVADLAIVVGYHASIVAGDLDEALQLFTEAIHTLDGGSIRLRARAYRLILLASTGRVEDVVEEWGELEESADSAADDDAAWVLRRASLVFSQDPELDVAKGLELAREAVLRSESLGAEARLPTLESLSWATLWADVEPEVRVTAAREVAEFARLHGDDLQLSRALSTLGIACHTSDQHANTALTDEVEDELLEVWERRGRQDREEYVIWTGIRRGMWDLAEWEIAAEERELRGRHRIQFLVPRACLRWMQGRLDEAEADLEEIRRTIRVRRWHHDYYPIRAEVAAAEGDLASTERWVDNHFAVPMAQREEIMRLGTLRALVRAHVDASDVEAGRAVVDRMRAVAEAHVSSVPTVQIGSEAFYLAAAEAELTRLTGPDPDAWERAEAETFWIYWTLYCRVRQIEARHALGEPVAGDAAELKAELEDLGAAGLLRLLDRATSRDG